MDIYVVSLTDYNNGILHGKWIHNIEDATADEVHEEIQEMLDASPWIAQYPDEVAEEWAIHDYSYDYTSLGLGESEDIAELVKLAQACEEHGEAFAAFYDYNSYNNESVEETIERFENVYQGEWRSLEEYAEQLCDDLGYTSEMPESLRYYIDYAAFGRDLELGGDIWTHEESYNCLHVFTNY